jgi:histidyl-tRNA synthetase
MKKSVKAQMKYANKIGARFTLVLGEDEIANRSAKIKNMQSGEEQVVNLDDLTCLAKLIKEQ